MKHQYDCVTCGRTWTAAGPPQTSPLCTCGSRAVGTDWPAQAVADVKAGSKAGVMADVLARLTEKELEQLVIAHVRQTQKKLVGLKPLQVEIIELHGGDVEARVFFPEAG